MPACDAQADVQYGSYRVEVRVNNVPVTSFPLIRSHNLATPDGVTLSGHTIMNLKRFDIVTLHLIPLTQTKYFVTIGGARLTIKKEPWW